jgi:hypothetical protein
MVQPQLLYILHNFVYIEPIVTTQGNCSHGPKVIPTTPKLKYAVAKLDVKCLTTRIPSHMGVIILISRKPPFFNQKFSTT